MIAADRMLRNHSDRFMTPVIHDDQTLQRATRGDPVEFEVDRPYFVGLSRTHQWLAIRDRDLLPPSAPNMQLLEPV